MRALLATLLFLCCAAVGAHAQQTPVKLVFFTADWCANCRVLEPELARAVSRVSGVERVDFDITTRARHTESIARAQQHGLARLHAAYAGRTGFAAIIAADTGETIACVTSAYASGEIEAALRRAITRVRSHALQARSAGVASSCPRASTGGATPAG